MRKSLLIWRSAILIAVAFVPSWGQEPFWPDLSTPARAVGGGAHDAAVVVGVEDYLRVPGVPGAKTNAKQWYQYLTETRGIPAQNVKFLANDDATREEILSASRVASGRVRSKGTLWFVFIGHGAPSPDGKDGLLVGVDAQQKAESLEARSVKRHELLKILGQSKASGIIVLLDACFSGRGQDGAAIVAGLQPLVTLPAIAGLDPRMAVLTAAKGNQFAGSLPGSTRPAFSYLVLGGIRGWASDGKKVAVTAGDLWRYATSALEATLRGRDQTPDLLGKADAVIGDSAGEKGPSLSKLGEATAGGAVEFKISALPEVPQANAPASVNLGNVPRANIPGVASKIEGVDFGTADIDALEKYDEVVKFEQGKASPEQKAAKWRALALEVKAYSDVARKRAATWDDYAAPAAYIAVVEKDKSNISPGEKRLAWFNLGSKYPKYAEVASKRVAEWERYSRELVAAEEARVRRIESRDKDWAKLRRLLALSVVEESAKRKFAETFINAYGNNIAENPYAIRLIDYLPEGTVKRKDVNMGSAIALMERVLINAGCDIKYTSENEIRVYSRGERLAWRNIGTVTRAQLDEIAFPGLSEIERQLVIDHFFPN